MTTEKIEQTQTGYRLEIRTTRGTEVRNDDIEEINELRANQPDPDEG